MPSRREGSAAVASRLSLTVADIKGQDIANVRSSLSRRRLTPAAGRDDSVRLAHASPSRPRRACHPSSTCLTVAAPRERHRQRRVQGHRGWPRAHARHGRLEPHDRCHESCDRRLVACPARLCALGTCCSRVAAAARAVQVSTCVAAGPCGAGRRSSTTLSSAAARARRARRGPRSQPERAAACG